MIELFEHNRIAYESACLQLDETGKACVVHPTGTGKSYIAFRWAEEHPLASVLWLTPSIYIYQTQLSNLQRDFDFRDENITCMTYAKLATLTDEELSHLNPDCICFDEAHRAGAQVWGLGVERLISKCPDAKLLGLTATPIRYLDKQRDMTEELFDGCIADTMTLGEAIARGILYAPKYVITLYSYDNSSNGYKRELKNYKDRIRRSSSAVRQRAEEYLDKLRRALEKAEGLDKIFAKHLKRRKYIVFCVDVAHMKEMVSRVSEWFSGVDDQPKVYIVWSDSATAKADYEAFQRDNSDHLRLLFCVDMFNEGIHVTDIDGVILFRPTISPIIFKQQIGRALSAVKTGTPLIIDAVNNFENLYTYTTVQTEIRDVIQSKKIERETIREIGSFQVIDEVRECRQLLTQLEETLSFSWEQMYVHAELYYQKNGHLNMAKRYKTETNVALGQWIYTQRDVYHGNRAGLLDNIRIAKLEAIGMNWEYPNEESWENGYTHLLAYKREFGNLDIHVRYICEDGFHLGQWILNQRKRYLTMKRQGKDPLSMPRFQLLNQVDIGWATREEPFETGLREAELYVHTYGNLDVPVKYVSPNGYKLGSWMGRIRGRYNRKYGGSDLTEEQIARLESLGMKWNSHFDEAWEKGYREAEAYYRQYGNLQVPINYLQNEYSLGRWIDRQRSAQRAGRLSRDRAMRLQQLGFSILTRNKKWSHYWQLAKQYFEEHGDLEIPPTYKAEDGSWLGKWVDNQRQAKRKGELSDSEIAELERIGIRWNNLNEEKWKTYFEMARKFPRSKDGTPMVPKDFSTPRGTSLWLWVKRQKQKYCSGKLPQELKRCWEMMLADK